jgi:hypothetical protein
MLHLPPEVRVTALATPGRFCSGRRSFRRFQQVGREFGEGRAGLVDLEHTEFVATNDQYLIGRLKLSTRAHPAIAVCPPSKARK